MYVRHLRELDEHEIIGPYGILSENSKGRQHYEPECDVRTCFQRDVDRITHSKAFRRLKHKTQVFLDPKGDHYRTRLTHTLEVTRLARTCARALYLNEDLAEAICLGHDLGHTPFGHAGERALNSLYPDGFKHYEQSLRVVDIIERDGKGLNLCYETRMGILSHTKGATDDTREATLARMCDQIAYLNHDLDDAVRGLIIRRSKIPLEIRLGAGERNSERINSFVTDLIYNSIDGNIEFSPEMKKTFDFFHSFMYSEVYANPIAKAEESKVLGIISGLYEYYVKNTDKLSPKFRKIADNEGAHRAACDYISGMTDGYAMEMYSNLYIPFSWSVK